MDDDVRERHLAYELDASHDHPADPEVDDLPRGAVHVRRIEGLEVFGLVRPTEGGKRPKSRREPRVENIRILGQPCTSALGAVARRIDRHDHMAVVAVVDRHAVSKPQLPADVPVAQPAQPVEVRALVALGMPAHLSCLRRVERLVAHLVHL